MFLLALAPSPARADSTSEDDSPEERSRVQASLRMGYSRPVGDFESSRTLAISQAISAAVPFTIDVGYRFRSLWTLGVFVGVAPGVAGRQFKGQCRSPGCDLMSYRFGGLAIASWNTDGEVSPWLGIGLGGEISTVTVSDPRGPVASTVRGFDFMNIPFGVTYRASRTWGFGPFLQVAVGTYTHYRVSTPRYSVDEGIDDWTLHAWFTAGARAVLWP